MPIRIAHTFTLVASMYVMDVVLVVLQDESRLDEIGYEDIGGCGKVTDTTTQICI